MDTILLHATAPTLPEDFCPADWQAVADALIEGAVFRLDSTGYSFYNYGDTTPAPEYRTYPWLRTILGLPDRWYIHYGNYWISPHPVPANSNLRQIWVGANDGTADGLWSFDGGDGTDPAGATTYSGAMWEVDTAFAARFPVGVGTLGSTAVAVTNTGGAASVTLAEENIPEHSHVLASDVNSTTPMAADDYLANRGKYGEDDAAFWLTGTDTEPTLGKTGEYGTAAPDAVSTVPPYYGVWFIKRTDKAYYTLPD